MIGIREELARALALSHGWDRWDDAASVYDTPGGNTPEDERDGWLSHSSDVLAHLASIGLPIAAIEAVRKGEAKVMPREITETQRNAWRSDGWVYNEERTYSVFYDAAPDWRG